MLSVKLAKSLAGFRLELAFEVGATEILVLWGRSGAGKTMTLRMVAGLLRPDAGEVVLRSRVLFSSLARVHLPPRERRCGLVFQDGALFPHLSVERNLLYGVNDGEPDQRHRLDELLDRFRLRAVAGRLPRELSAGERQRVAVARALLARPEVLLLDEPTAALDRDTRRAVQDALLSAQRACRVPVVLVTHDPDEAERVGTRVLELREGRVTSS